MFGVSEGMAQVLIQERRRALDCRGELRTWCTQEFRTVIRHG